MKNKVYTIRVNITDNLYADYIVEAENLFFAKIKVRQAFFRDYPGAMINTKLSLINPNDEVINEIMKIIKEAK